MLLLLLLATFSTLKRRERERDRDRDRDSSDMAKDSDYGAFMEKFVLQPSPSDHELPLSGLTFAVKDLSVLIYTLFHFY